jgi:hypothetical protein
MMRKSVEHKIFVHFYYAHACQKCFFRHSNVRINTLTLHTHSHVCISCNKTLFQLEIIVNNINCYCQLTRARVDTMDVDGSDDFTKTAYSAIEYIISLLPSA